MSFSFRCVSYTFAGLMALSGVTFVNAQQPAAKAPATAVASRAQAAIDQAAKDGKFTFLMFYKTTDAASNAMAATLKEALAERSEQAVIAYVQVGNAAEQALVTKYDVSRAPMPMTIAVAPNGAMTGMFAQKVTVEKTRRSVRHADDDVHDEEPAREQARARHRARFDEGSRSGRDQGFSERSAFQRSHRHHVVAGG